MIVYLLFYIQGFNMPVVIFFNNFVICELIFIDKDFISDRNDINNYIFIYDKTCFRYINQLNLWNSFLIRFAQ